MNESLFVDMGGEVWRLWVDENGTEFAQCLTSTLLYGYQLGSRLPLRKVVTAALDDFGSMEAAYAHVRRTA